MSNQNTKKANMSQKYEKLKSLLKQLFQLDQPDLDFGLYRIMHAKSAEVTQFLDKDLLPQVQAAFALYKTADKAEIEKELAKVIAGIEAAGMEPDQSPKVKDLRARLKSDAVDVGGLESEVYEHLFSFFRRYYSEGDYLSRRVYKPGVYAIPYEGEEVKLHWANADQYYIKTSEYLRDYAFRLRPDDDKAPLRVHFRLVDVAEGGLIEGSISVLTGGQPALSVCARPEDLREPAPRGRLIKFHGCAIRATQDEVAYRPFLVARQSQINGWLARPENAALRARLVGLIATKPTLMVGLSAQDANIQALFAEAAAQMAWRWPGDRPSYVFSENELGGDQQGLLQNVYRLDLTPANRQQILDGSRIQAYAKPLLVALVLHLLCGKVKTLIDLAGGALAMANRQPLRDGVVALRNQLAACVAPDSLAFMNAFIDQCGRSMHLVRNGSLAHAVGRYQPLTVESIPNMPGNPDLPASGMREAAVAAGILGAGVSRGEWAIDTPASKVVRDGMFRLTTPAGNAKVFLTSGPYAALQLRQEGHVVDADEPIVIQGHKLVPAMTRSPRGAPGRTGRIGAREVSIASLLEASVSFDELFQRFREELAI